MKGARRFENIGSGFLQCPLCSYDYGFLPFQISRWAYAINRRAVTDYARWLSRFRLHLWEMENAQPPLKKALGGIE